MKNLANSVENVSSNQVNIFENIITIEQLEERLETTDGNNGSIGYSGTCNIM